MHTKRCCFIRPCARIEPVREFVYCVPSTLLRFHCQLYFLGGLCCPVLQTDWLREGADSLTELWSFSFKYTKRPDGWWHGWLVTSLIFTSSQPHRVTSGRIAHSQLLYRSTGRNTSYQNTSRKLAYSSRHNTGFVTISMYQSTRLHLQFQIAAFLWVWSVRH